MNRKTALQTFVYCLLIAAVLAAGFIFTNPPLWRRWLLEAFVFSMCIGFSISFLVHFLKDILDRWPIILRLSALFMLFLIGGTFGTTVAYLVLTHLFGVQLEEWTRLFLLNLVLSALFGSAAVIYFSLRNTAERMAATIRAKEAAEEKLVRLKTEAELAALQAKVNPHFLFNTLNSIASLIAENPAEAEATVEKLSGLFRYTLHHTGSASVQLSEELEIVRWYLEIEKVRFGDRLHFEIRKDDRCDRIDVPALLIQPLVENSIKHAIAPEVRGGSIRVETRLENGQCVITVWDSGGGFTETTGESGFGLRGIRERLKLIYGGKAALRICEGPNTQIQITLPLS